MIQQLRAFCWFWYDFIVGDDWVIAVGVLCTLLVTRRLLRLEINAWWLMPLAVVALLALSLWRLTRPRTKKPHISSPPASQP